MKEGKTTILKHETPPRDNSMSAILSASHETAGSGPRSTFADCLGASQCAAARL